MSRTSFAVRFKKIAGVAPLTYLLNLRMRFAEEGLREGSMSVSELGLSLGYTTESAFSNAFKRTTGWPPSDTKTSLPVWIGQAGARGIA
jgi:AraC-like DNA-binding protein